MKISRRIHRALAALSCLVLAAAVFLSSVPASEPDPCVLNIRYMDENTPIAGASFRVYRAAALQQDGGYALTEEFKGSGAVLNSRMRNEEWMDAAGQLKDWAKKNHIEEDGNGKTGDDGSLLFEGLREGLYLVDGDPLETGERTLVPQPFCVVIPGRNQDGELQYRVDCAPKYEIETEPIETEPPETERPTESETLPTEEPTEVPTEVPTEELTEAPTEELTETPTERPTENETQPTEEPTEPPETERPTESETLPTEEQTEAPTENETQPTEEPTEPPTERPTEEQTEPTEEPTEAPTENETQLTEEPTEPPTERPTESETLPTEEPTEVPTEVPTEELTEAPTEELTETPTERPTENETQPTESPTENETQPTEEPTEPPTERPTESETLPTEEPTEVPTEELTEPVTERPTEELTEAPTEELTETPTERPTESETQPTESPTESETQLTEPPTESETLPTEELTEAPTEEPTEPPTESETPAPDEPGRVEVRKALHYIDEGISVQLYARDQVFYAALFEDPECTVMASNIQELRFTDSSSASAVFEGLEAGKTYYLGELDANGNLLQGNMGVLHGGIINQVLENTEGDVVFNANFSGGNKAEVTEGNEAARVTFANEFYELPYEFYMNGVLKITKKVLDPDGNGIGSNDTFYAGIFADPEFSELSRDVEYSVIPLSMDGNSEVSNSVNVRLHEADEQIRLYVTEVDENGVPVDSSFGYTVSVSGNGEVSFDAHSLEQTVVITNQMASSGLRPEPTESPKPAESQKETETGSDAAKTGDDTPIIPFVMCMLLAMAVMRMAAGSRKKWTDGH